MFPIILASCNLITFLCTCLFFYESDKYLVETRRWKKYKCYPYTQKIWTIWRTSFIQSMKNHLYAFIFLLFLPVPEETISLSDFGRLPLYVLHIETVFYFIHRLFHTGLLWKFHRIHHKTTTTVAASVFDSDVVEHILLNAGSILSGYFLYGGSKILIIFLCSLGTITGCVAHSGYKCGSRIHILHHKKSNVNYGQGFHIWDRIFGSYSDS